MASPLATHDVLGEDVSIPTRAGPLLGTLSIPAKAGGLVAFAHGSGSSRLSSRNRFVAETLQRRGLATLLFDLLTAQEERIDDVAAEYRFDIRLLATRLASVTDWIRSQPRTRDLTVGYFGASTGAAAALVAAAHRSDVAAIVSRGGRPDLAGSALALVRTPTLLIVGQRDDEVVELNRDALRRLQRGARHELALVPRATHLFEEPGALEEAARLAGDWFEEFLTGTTPTHAAGCGV